MAKLDLTNYVNGGYAYLFVETEEIKRAVDSIMVRENLKSGDIKVLHWNMVEGIRELAEITINKGTGEKEIKYKYVQGVDLINSLKSHGQKVLIVAELFSDLYLNKAEIIQRMLNVTFTLKSNNITFCIVSTDRDAIPKPLQKLFTVIDFALPTKEEFREFLQAQCDGFGLEYKPEVADACMGLSMEEGENAMTKMLLDYGECRLESIIEAKRQIFEKTGFMSLIMPEPQSEVGGLHGIKDDLKRRLEAFQPGSIKPKVRAIFTTGVQGCGKSSVAKMLGDLFNRPVIIGDLGAMKGSLVGETGKNTRQFTKIVDASGPVIVIWDEVEKALAGATGQSLDGGASSGQFGHLLTWMQERKSEAIIVATSNDITMLPPEFLRCGGRWDVRFFFGFPNKSERREIVEIMNRRWKSNLPTTDEFIEKLDHFTGAEISQAAMDSHFYDDLDMVLAMVPRVWDINREKIERILKFANQMRNASIPDPVETKDQVTEASPEAKRSIDIDFDSLKDSIKKKILD